MFANKQTKNENPLPQNLERQGRNVDQQADEQRNLDVIKGQSEQYGKLNREQVDQQRERGQVIDIHEGDHQLDQIEEHPEGDLQINQVEGHHVGDKIPQAIDQEQDKVHHCEGNQACQDRWQGDHDKTQDHPIS